MKDERKYYFIYGFIVLILSLLLFLKYISSIILSNSYYDGFILDLLGLIWPIIGLTITYEFLRKNLDKTGWGGIFFHIFVLFCGIYHLILIITGIFDFSLSFEFIFNFLLNLMICLIGWFSYFFYYD